MNNAHPEVITIVAMKPPKIINNVELLISMQYETVTTSKFYQLICFNFSILLKSLTIEITLTNIVFMDIKASFGANLLIYIEQNIVVEST